jgi:hypothetical protein
MKRKNQLLLIEDYFDRATRNIAELRNRCAPYSSPVDTLRCMFDEAWPAGAHLESLYGRKMYVGLSRVVKPGVCFLAHHDIFAKDAPDSFQARSLEAQFACNVYLNMPTEGGALQMWDHDISPEQFDEMRGDSYGIDPALLGTPSLDIPRTRRFHHVQFTAHALGNTGCGRSTLEPFILCRLSRRCFPPDLLELRCFRITWASFWRWRSSTFLPWSPLGRISP